MVVLASLVPRPIPSFSMLHAASRFSTCNIENLGMGLGMRPSISYTAKESTTYNYYLCIHVCSVYTIHYKLWYPLFWVHSNNNNIALIFAKDGQVQRIRFSTSATCAVLWATQYFCCWFGRLIAAAWPVCRLAHAQNIVLWNECKLSNAKHEWKNLE